MKGEDENEGHMREEERGMEEEKGEANISSEQG